MREPARITASSTASTTPMRHRQEGQLQRQRHAAEQLQERVPEEGEIHQARRMPRPTRQLGAAEHAARQRGQREIEQRAAHVEIERPPRHLRAHLDLRA